MADGFKVQWTEEKFGKPHPYVASPGPHPTQEDAVEAMIAHMTEHVSELNTKIDRAAAHLVDLFNLWDVVAPNGVPHDPARNRDAGTDESGEVVAVESPRS